jgi:hypothetical protein
MQIAHQKSHVYKGVYPCVSLALTTEPPAWAKCVCGVSLATTNGPAGLQTAASIWSLQQTLGTSADMSFSKSTRGACTLTVQHALPGLSQGTGNHAAVTESGTIIPCTRYLRDGD